MRKTTITSFLAASVLVLAACGGSDSGSASGDQGRVADLVIELSGEQGFELDEACVNETVSELSDADAKALADSELAGDAETSDEAEAIGQKVFTDCVDAESYVNSLADSIAEDDDTIDAQCVKDELAGLTVDEVDDQIFDAAFACTDS